MKVDTKAKKLGLKSYIVDMGIFDFSVRFIVGDYVNAVRLVNWYYDMGPESFYSEFDDSGKGSTFYQKPYCPVVWLPRFPRTDMEHGTLAHECCHAVAKLFQWGSMPIDASTDEVFANAVGYLVRAFREQARR